MKKATASLMLASLMLLCTIQAGVSRSLLDTDSLKHHVHLNKREELGAADTNEQVPRMVVPIEVLPALISRAPGAASPAPPIQPVTPDPQTRLRIDRLIEDITNNVNSAA